MSCSRFCNVYWGMDELLGVSALQTRIGERVFEYHRTSKVCSESIKNRSHPETRENLYISLKNHLISDRKPRVNIRSFLSCNHVVLTAEASGLKLKLGG